MERSVSSRVSVLAVMAGFSFIDFCPLLNGWTAWTSVLAQKNRSPAKRRDPDLWQITAG